MQGDCVWVTIETKRGRKRYAPEMNAGLFPSPYLGRVAALFLWDSRDSRRWIMERNAAAMDAARPSNRYFGDNPFFN